MARPAEQPVSGQGGGPELPAKAPKLPSWMHPYAAAEWRRLVKLLVPLGCLTEADQQTLAALCQAVAEQRIATETVAAEGRVVRTGGVMIQAADPLLDLPEKWEGGQLQPHPAIAQQRSAWAAVRAFSALFGLDPASRGKLPAVKRSKPRGVQARQRE